MDRSSGKIRQPKEEKVCHLYPIGWLHFRAATTTIAVATCATRKTKEHANAQCKFVHLKETNID